jgi:hypothetical protein
MADRRNVGLTIMDTLDPYELAAFIDENERQADELRRDLAERQERHAAGVDREWLVPRPEQAPAAVRAPQRQQAHNAEWAAHCRQSADAAVAALRREMKADQRKQLAAMADAMGRVVAEERDRHAEQIKQLRAEYDAKLQGLLAGIKLAQQSEGASDDLIVDMGKALRAHHGGSA